jgi:hypothetical protein
MKILLKQIVIAISSSILLAACATTEPESDLGDDINPHGSDCISIRTIRDYTPLDRSSLILEATGKRFYYVTLSGSAFELRSSFRIGVESRDDWLCPYGGDRLVVDGLGSSASFGNSIRGIDRITAEQAEELLYRHGRKERPESEQQDPPPELGGAEVEEIGESPDEQENDVPRQ